MAHNSENSIIFVALFGNRRRHRGELISFDPSENLENSTWMGEKSESCFSCSNIYTAFSFYGVGLHIYLQVWADFHSYIHGYSRTFRL